MTFRPATTADLDQILRLWMQGFNTTRADAERYRERAKIEQFRVVEDAGAVKAIMRWFPFGHFFGGRAVRAAGVASVAVSPDTRGRGIGKELMVESMKEIRAAGFPISSLYPATVPLYRSVGYGFAMVRTNWKSTLGALPDVREEGVSLSPVSSSEVGELNTLYEHIAAGQNGLVQRSAEWWNDNVLNARDESTRWAYLVREDGDVTGWIIYETQSSSGNWRFKLSCRDLFWSTPGAARALLSMASLHRSTAEEIAWTGAPDEPIQWLTKDHAIEPDGSFHAMVRLMDVPAAFEARGYPAAVDASFTIRVSDPLFQQNEGPWRVEVSGGSAKVVRVDDARARCDVQGLASLWSCALRPRDAVRLGVLDADEETLSALDVVFAGPTPWIADFY
ncbi:MAG: enhanced intracellular survival protein Eis [Actinomycetota bacterium]